MVSQEQIKTIGCVLNNKERPLKERFRALFTLKNIGGADAIDEISRGFTDDSALLKHELAYCLGQMQDKKALGILTQVLEDVNQEPMVRHEAAEAMGAIGAADIIPILEKYKNDRSSRFSFKYGILQGSCNWPKTKATSCLNRAEASFKPSVIASTDSSVRMLRKLNMAR